VGSTPHRPLRVCQLAYTYYDFDNRVLRYAEYLADRGDRVDVIALRFPKGPPLGDSGNIRVFRIQSRSRNEKAAWVYLAKILWFFVKSAVLLAFLQLRGRHDVVHVHNVPEFLVFAALVPKLFGARVILDIHDIGPELYGGKFGTKPGSRMFKMMVFVERMSCRFADHVIVANHIWHKKLIQRSVPPRKCTPIMNYPDRRFFQGPPTDHERADRRFIFMYPGTLSHLQGLDIAIEAFALVRDQMPGAEFHIYGEGPSRPELEALTKARGVEDAVKFQNVVTHTEIPKVIASANVGVVPKRAEGFGNEAFSTKILEFMACGVPVIVSRTRIDAYYFNDSLVRFFESGDPDDLARAMLSVYEHRAEHGAWARRAYDFAVRNSWQERSTDYRNIVDGSEQTASVGVGE